MSQSAIRRAVGAGFLLAAVAAGPWAAAAGTTGLAGAVTRFGIERTDINLSRPAQPFTYFDKVGRKFAILGAESGSFEAWAYPLKLLRNFSFSFLVGTSTVPVEGRDIVRFVSVDPAVTTLTFTFQSFTVKAHYIAAIDEPGAVILLEVDAVEPLTIVCSFTPVLQPMWPAGLGGQYAAWDGSASAYIISEPTRKNHGLVGSPAAKGISYTPAHMLADVPNQFEIEISDPKTAAGIYLPVVLAGGKGRREDVTAIYQKLAADPRAVYENAVRHYEELRTTTLKIETPESRLDLAFEWAKVALDNLVVDNPDLGRGLVAGLGASGTSGRPGFGWFFGTDAYLNSLSLNSFGAYETSRQALAFTQKWQREDGKMAHELSQGAGYIDWWKDYPYGYIHGDTTPYYIVAMEDYVERSGDVTFLKASWPSLVKAYQWCLSTDENGDGLMDNAKAGLGALEFGSLTGIRTDIYLAAVWARAARAMADMAAAYVKDFDRARSYAAVAKKAAAELDAKFWDAANRQYAYAFNDKGELLKELTPWSAMPLVWGLGTLERGVETLAAMNASDLTTDWGVRMISLRSPLFEPLNYNYGAAWPFLTGWVATTLLQNGFTAQGLQDLRGAAAHTFDNALGQVTELFSGYANIWPQEAVAHQGFSTSGVVLPLLRGLFGLDGRDRGISFAPAFPADWDHVSFENWRLGGGVYAISYDREERRVSLRITSSPKDIPFVFAPVFGPGTRVVSANFNGSPAQPAVAINQTTQGVRTEIRVILTGDDTLTLELAPAPEIVVPPFVSKTGELNRGLKVIRTDFAAPELKVTVEGLAGENYALEIRNADRVASVTGAVLDAMRLRFNFPSGRPGEFIRKEIVLRLKT